MIDEMVEAKLGEKAELDKMNNEEVAGKAF